MFLKHNVRSKRLLACSVAEPEPTFFSGAVNNLFFRLDNRCWYPKKLLIYKTTFLDSCLQPLIGLPRLICSSLIRSFAHLFKSLKSLRTNEQMWAICSGRSGQMSDCEQIAQVVHEKWANVSDLLRLLTTNEWFAQKKSKKIVFFVRFIQLFEVKKSFAHSFWAKWVNCLRSLRTNERPWAIRSRSLIPSERPERIAQVAHQKWAIRSLRNSMSKSPTLLMTNVNINCY